MTISLRPYQAEACDALARYLRDFNDHPVIVLPTGSGKTPVIAYLCREYLTAWPSTRILILAHVKELLAQAEEKILAMWPEGRERVGVYSAGMGRRDTDTPIVIAGIQSVFNKADQLGSFDLIFVDECHLIPADGEGMYRTLIADLKVINPALRVVGFTATPYRLDCGLICDPAHLLNSVCYEANVKSLIEQGFLSKLRSKGGHEVDVSSVHTRGGDFIASELDDALSDDAVVKLACEDIAERCADRKAIVVFCSGVNHAALISAELAKHGIEAPIITGETPTAERDDLVARFKRGELRALCNINVLSIGFDAPHIDAVVMLRPTQSPGLYYQQVGRGLRIAPGKSDCLVLDLAGNVRRHGPIDQVDPSVGKKGDGDGEAPTKTCPECDEIILLGAVVCPACGFEFPRPVVKHAPKAEAVQPISETIEETWSIQDVHYSAHKKKDAPEGHPRTLRVEYRCGFKSVSEWVCVEHPPGFAARKAVAWLVERDRDGRISDVDSPDCAGGLYACTNTDADTASDSLDADDWAAFGNRGWLTEPSAVVVKLGGKYPEIARFVWAKPCAGCKHYDGGHCHHWGQDVPADHAKTGCEQHAELPAAPVPNDDADEPPF